MAGFAPGYSATVLDLVFPTTGASDWIAYSINGTSEFSGMARTSVGATGWAAGVSGSPATKANSAVLTTATATSGGTITHFAVYTASTAGTQKSDWTALTASKTVANGDSLSWAAGTLGVTLD